MGAARRGDVYAGFELELAGAGAPAEVDKSLDLSRQGQRERYLKAWYRLYCLRR